MIHQRKIIVSYDSFLKCEFVLSFPILRWRLPKESYFICYFMTMLINMSMSFLFCIAIAYKRLGLSSFCWILHHTSVREAYSEPVKRAIVDHHAVWSVDCVLCFTFIFFFSSVIHFVPFKFSINVTLALDYSNIILASLGFSFHCRQWQVVTC